MDSNLLLSSKARRLSSALAMAATILSAGTVGAQEACTEMQVFLNISHNHRDHVMSFIAPVLKQETGVNLIAEELGSGNMKERIMAQLPQPRITIAHWDVSIGVDSCGQDMCSPIDLSKAPNAGKLEDWAYARNAAGEPVVLTAVPRAVGLIYNEEAFASAGIEPPTSWKDLDNPALAGRVSIISPASGFGIAALVKFAKLDGGDEDNIDPAFARVEKLGNNLHSIHTWSSELSNLLQLGEVWLSAASSDLSPVLRANGLPVKWILPEEGAPLSSAGVSVIKGSPCQDVAMRYLDLYFSEEFQLLRARSGFPSAVASVWEKLTPEETAQMDLTDKDFGKVEEYDWAKIYAARSAWIERWQREVR